MNIDKSIAKEKIVGVSFIESRDRWLAQGKLGGKSKFLGYYKTKSDAIVARNEFGRQFLEPKMRERDVFERHIIDLYMSGKSQEETGKMVGLNASSICEILKNNKIEARDNFITLDDGLICRSYNSGKTLQQVAREFNVSDGTIKERLKKHNIKIRPNRKYFFDETIFEKIDTEWKAYFLGLLYADGGVNKTSVNIALHHQDSEVLKKIAYIIYGNCSILKTIKEKKCYNKKTKKTYNSSKKCLLAVNSKKFVDDIIKLGCFRKKSFILKFPSYDIVPENIFHHFIRGYFDGDGCSWHSKKSNSVELSIISSKDYCVGFQEYLNSKLQINSRVRVEGKVARTIVSRGQDVIKIYNYMYKDATIYFKRKRDKIENWMYRLS